MYTDADYDGDIIDKDVDVDFDADIDIYTGINGNTDADRGL